MCLLLLITLVPRLVCAAGGTFAWDLWAFSWWSSTLASGNLHTFYHVSGTDYLPGYLYVLLGLGKLAPALLHLPGGFSSWLLTDRVLYKLPAIAADVVTVEIIFIGGRRLGGARPALLAAVLYALIPGVLGNSARWGQMDSVPACLLVLALFLFIEGSTMPAAVFFTLSMVTKPTALVLVPLVATTLVCTGRVRDLGRAAVVSLVTGTLVFLPFVPAGSNVLRFAWFGFQNTSGRYPVLTLQAFNFWTAYCSINTDVMSVAPTSTKALGVSCLVWGWILLSAVVLPVCVVLGLHLKRMPRGGESGLLPASCLVTLAFYLFLTSMHERHMLPALPLLALTAVMVPRFWIFYLWFAASYTLNLHYVDPAMFPPYSPVLGVREVALTAYVNLAAFALAGLSYRHALDTIQHSCVRAGSIRPLELTMAADVPTPAAARPG